jgi:membrane protein DedA with SNARE-associated domain
MVDSLTQWLETLNPLVVQLINLVLLIIEGIGVPAVPYEASMLALGLMIENGQTTIWESVLYGAIGNTIGNVIGYYIGPRGLRMISQKTQKRLGLLQIQNLLERYGPWMAVISRWFGPLRTLFILYARTAGLKPLPYAACSFVGALTWTAVWQVGMWLGGKALVEVWHRYQFYGVGVLVIIGVPTYLILRRRRLRREAQQEALDASQSGAEGGDPVRE